MSCLVIGGNIRYIFLLGERKGDKELQAIVKSESEMYQDILQGDFIDSYYNLTLKTIMGFRWVSQKCGHARFVVKVDDDVYINIENLMSALELYEEELQTSVGGFCGRDCSPKRHESSKWYLSYDDYPYDTFPPYCIGPTYVTSMLLAKRLYVASKDVKLFPFEDVFIGFCLSKLGHGWTFIPGFHVLPTEVSVCKVRRSSTIIALHPLSPSDIQWWLVYPDTFVPGRYVRINEFSGLLNRPLVRTWKSVPTLFVRTNEISGLSEPGLTNHHCNESMAIALSTLPNSFICWRD